ncbi:MAG: hypothetical protein PVF07_01675 [Thiogranum sp.]|jgi:hypothetical protein
MTPRRDLDWWYWLATDLLLVAGLAGWRWGMLPVIGLTLVQVVHYLARERRVTAFPVQVRAGYLLLLVAGLFQPLAFIHWIQLAGTTAVVTVGYCPLARILALMPWNRDQPLTLDFVRKTVFSPPVAGSILGAQPGE